MRTFLLLIYLSILIPCNAQHIEKFYDYAWRPVDVSASRYFTIIDKEDSVWHRKDYFIHEKKFRMDGSFLDSSCKIAHGNFRYYYPNGNLESTGNYLNNKRDGLWLIYFSDGTIKDSAVYNRGKPTGISLKWYPGKRLADSASWNKDGSGNTRSWFDNGVVSLTGNYSARSRHDGEWKFYNKNGKLSSLEIYRDGALLSKQYFDESGNAMDTANRDRRPLFVGGNEAWRKYMLKELYFPQGYKIVNAEKAVVVVDAVIDEEGNATNVEVSSPFYPAFDKIAVDMMKHSPKWLPAIEHNRAVKFGIHQPISFGQKELNYNF